MKNTEEQIRSQFNELRRSHEGKHEDEIPLILKAEEEIIACVKGYHKIADGEGFSGATHGDYSPVFISYIEKLINNRSILPIEDKPEQWNDISRESGGEMYQHRRDSRVFKKPDEENNYHITALDSIVYKPQKGSCFTGNIEGLHSARVLLRHYKHKTFYLDVIEWEVFKDYWNNMLKEPSQLDELHEYYGIKTPFEDKVRFRKLKCWFWQKVQETSPSNPIKKLWWARNRRKYDIERKKTMAEFEAVELDSVALKVNTINGDPINHDPT